MHGWGISGLLSVGIGVVQPAGDSHRIGDFIAGNLLAGSLMVAIMARAPRANSSPRLGKGKSGMTVTGAWLAMKISIIFKGLVMICNWFSLSIRFASPCPFV